MTFPYCVEASANTQEDGGEAPQHVDLQPSVLTAGLVSGCAGCDGSGLWRGIDGFVFVCPHCCYEMT